MIDKNIVLGMIGFLLSVYGGSRQDLISLVLGLLLLFLDIKLNQSEQGEEIKDLNMRLDIYQDIVQIKKDVEKNKQELVRIKHVIKK